MNIVKLGPEYFPEKDRSRALSGGSIYVGKPDTDPSIPANQKKLYVQQESGAIVETLQPIGTSAGGVPTYAGSAVTLLTDGNYSLLALNSLGSQEYYIPSVDGGPVDGGLSDYGCNFEFMVSTVGSVNPTHIVVDCDPDDLTGNLTIPDNITLEWRSGHALGGAFTLTVEGDVIAGEYRLFDDVLTVEGLRHCQPAWFGSVGDGVTDDTDAFVKAVSAGGIVNVPNPTISYVTLFDATDALTILANLGNFRPVSRLDFNFDSMDITVPDTVEIDDPACGNIYLNGAAQTVTALKATASDGTVDSIDNISGNYNNYNVILRFDIAHGYSTGDWIMVRTEGNDVTVSNPDETAVGSRHNELDGFLEIRSVPSPTSIIVIVKSRQSSANFPGAGTISANTSRTEGGSANRVNTIFNFEGVDGFNISSHLGGIADIGIIGDGAGPTTSGIRLGSVNTMNINQDRSVGLVNVGVANFSGSGINLEGFNCRASGYNVMSCGNDGSGVRVKSATVSFDASIASNNGVNGFFATTSANLACRNSIANGNRNTGFIANRSSSVTASDSIAGNNGNYQDEVDGGFSDREGKGFESEGGSIMTCEDSTAIFNTELGFYALAASKSYCHDCVGSGSLVGSGFYSILNSEMSARRGVSRNNNANGFYATSLSSIMANDSDASGNLVDGYQAVGGSTITADGAVDTTSTNVPVDAGGPNQIIVSGGTDRLGLNGVITRGDNLTIASGEITVFHGNHRVDTEAGAATDNLDTINGGVDGQILTIRMINTARDIVVRHGVGNIQLIGSTNKTLDVQQNRLTLIYDEGLDEWSEVQFWTP